MPGLAVHVKLIKLAAFLDGVLNGMYTMRYTMKYTYHDMFSFPSYFTSTTELNTIPIPTYDTFSISNWITTHPKTFVTQNLFYINLSPQESNMSDQPGQGQPFLDIPSSCLPPLRRVVAPLLDHSISLTLLPPFFPYLPLPLYQL